MKPRWILSLVLAMAIAAVFVLLSQWQFSRSRSAPPPPPAATEQVRDLTRVFTPGTPMTAQVADQMVTMDGWFVSGTRTLISGRLQEGEEGFWLVSAFAVAGGESGASDGASGDGRRRATGAVIPVVHGWLPERNEAAHAAIPEGDAAVVGRLLPTEAPVSARPVPGEYASLATAELVNIWDRPIYAGFVVASSVQADGVAWHPSAPLEAVVVGPQPQSAPVNWLNVFYAVEWFVFAGFAFFLWWRLVADDHRRGLEEAQEQVSDQMSEQGRGTS